MIWNYLIHIKILILMQLSYRSTIHKLVNIKYVLWSEHYSDFFPYNFKETLVSMKWDPTGHILMTCAKEENVKLWGPVSGCWRCLHSLCHPSTVNGIAWCSLPGKGSKMQLLMATYVLNLCVCVLIFMVVKPVTWQ